MLGQRVINNILGNKPKADRKSRNNEENEFVYRGVLVTRQFPSGMYEFYSDKKGQFIKADTLQGIKKEIQEEKTWGK